MPCCFEAEPAVRSGYNYGLSAKVGGGVGQGPELGFEEAADEVLGSGRVSVAFCELPALENVPRRQARRRGNLDSQVEVREGIPHGWSLKSIQLTKR